MVGSAVALEAEKQGFDVIGKSSTELDLTDRAAVFDELRVTKPKFLVIAAAKVGGIGANSSYPVDFLSVNLQIQTNLLDAAHTFNVEKVLFLGSSCVYPRLASQPISESALLTGELEPTNEPYAIAKIAGLKLVEAYRRQFGHNWISAMPTSLYGPRDNFNPTSAHVLPMLMRRFHKAKMSQEQVVEIWGDGSPLREFLHVEDFAIACLLVLKKFDSSVAINIGSGKEISIKNLATLIGKTVGYSGEIIFNPALPNGTPRKLLNSALMSELGWKPSIDLEQGVKNTYDWFLNNQSMVLQP